MAHWIVDTNKVEDKMFCPLPYGVDFYGELKNGKIEIDLDKPIKKGDTDYNISKLIGVGSTNTSITIDRLYVSRILPTWAKVSIVVGGIGVLALSIYEVVKLNKLGY